MTKITPIQILQEAPAFSFFEKSSRLGAHGNLTASSLEGSQVLPAKGVVEYLRTRFEFAFLPAWGFGLDAGWLP